jgi:predicted RNA-binding Zn-ribbon protein involved in translation (DUF1610 family)
MKIDTTQLDIKLADKGANQKCPVCGRPNWTVDDDPAAVNAIDPDTDEILLGTALPAAVMVCKNCGFIRLHAVEVLLGKSD